MNKIEKKAYMVVYREKHEKALKAWRQRYYRKTREKQIEYALAYLKKYPEKKLIDDKKYRHSEKCILSRRKNRLLKRDKLNAWKRLYRIRKFNTDANYRLRTALTGRIYAALKGRYLSKAYKSMELIGTSMPQVRKHIESQFQPGMSWQNYGKWHVDHIRPLSSFDLIKPSEQKEAFYYKNLQPLWAFENLSKGAKY